VVISKQKRLYVLLGGLVIGMFAFGYALVPLYSALCSTLGINGKTGGAVNYDESKAYIDKKRWITVEFVTNNNQQLPWEFRANTFKVKIHPGQMEKVTFYAKNLTNKAMTVQAIPSVTPGIAAKYLKKTECFCFTHQTLDGQTARDMPVLFHLDTELPKYIKTITLSYTLFDVTNKKKPVT